MGTENSSLQERLENALLDLQNFDELDAGAREEHAKEPELLDDEVIV